MQFTMAIKQEIPVLTVYAVNLVRCLRLHDGRLSFRGIHRSALEAGNQEFTVKVASVQLTWCAAPLRSLLDDATIGTLWIIVK